MATIPVYRRQIADPSGLGPTPRASGADPTGQALSQLGATVSRIGQEQFQRLKAQEDEDARLWVGNALSGDHLKWIQRRQELEDAAEPGAPKFAQTLLDEFDGYKSEAIKNAPNDTAKRFYSERLNALGTSLFEKGVHFEATQRAAWKVQQATEAADRIADLAAISPDQATIAWAEQLAALKGYENKAFAQHQEGVLRDKVSTSAVTAMVERDAVSALPLLDKRMAGENTRNPFVDSLPGDKVVMLRHRAQAYVQAAAARVKADGDKALKEAEDSFKTLQTFAISGEMPSTDYQSEVLAKTRGTPYADGTRLLLEQSMKGAAFGAQPLPAQDQQIRALDAQRAGGTSPEADKLMNFAREVNNRQREAYKENPWAAATRFGRLQPAPEVALTSADQLPQFVAQRLPQMTAIETYAGAPVSPLQPNEAKQMVTLLSGLPPDQRANSLAQTGAMLSLERIGALADQLDKTHKPTALALKLGTDRTTAGRTVSELVLRGAQAIADKTIKRDDAALTGWRSEIAALVRGTLGDARAEQDVIEAAYFVRAAMDDKGTPVPGFNLDASNENAVRMVIGQPVVRAGIKTVLPRGMTEDQFTDKLRALTPDMLRPLAPNGVFVRGQARTLEQLSTALPSMGMKRDGQGRFVPVSGGAVVTLDPSGQIPLRLEVR